MLATYKMHMIYDGGTTYQHTGTVVTKALNKRQAKTFAINEGIRKHNPEGESIEVNQIYKLYTYNEGPKKTYLQYWNQRKIK